MIFKKNDKVKLKVPKINGNHLQKTLSHSASEKFDEKGKIKIEVFQESDPNPIKKSFVT